MRRFNGHNLCQARLHADKSRGDLAFVIRHLSSGRIKATERGIRGWEKGETSPGGDTIPVIAEALGRSIDYFYAAGADEDE